MGQNRNPKTFLEFFVATQAKLTVMFVPHTLGGFRVNHTPVKGNLKPRVALLWGLTVQGVRVLGFLFTGVDGRCIGTNKDNIIGTK